MKAGFSLINVFTENTSKRGRSMYIIDRFEGDWAVIEAGKVTFSVPRSLIPEEARVGDVLNIHIEIDAEATKERRKRIQKLMDDVFE